ncbi:MAG: hypothetical protein AAGI27_17285 [Pseudomonadota bacterium]
MQHTRLSGVIVLATGVATVTLLFLLLYSYATQYIGFVQALIAALLVFLPIACIGLCRPHPQAARKRQYYSDPNT